ncbi:MAG: hypothetical protein IKV21_05640 [Clostridia bacterium]|nr:hypothetical protein [Clostridia bacterium]
MNKKDLWNIFMKTGKVSDYLKYKSAADSKHAELLDSMDTEAAEEFYLNNPDAEEFDYDDFDGWYNN